MSYQIVDKIRILGLQNYNVYEKLNPIEINIHDSEIQGKLWRYGTQRYRYHFITNSLVIIGCTIYKCDFLNLEFTLQGKKFFNKRKAI